MPKLTAAQVRSIETVLYHLDRASNFIHTDRTVLAIKKSRATTTLDFLLPDGTAATEIDKHIGSDLCGLQDGIEYLKNFLTMNAKVYTLPAKMNKQIMRDCEKEIEARHKKGIFDIGDPNHPDYNGGYNYATQSYMLFGYEQAEFLDKQYKG